MTHPLENIYARNGTLSLIPTLNNAVDNARKCPLCSHKIRKGEPTIDNLLSGFWGAAPKFRTLHIACWMLCDKQNKKTIKLLFKPSIIKRLTKEVETRTTVTDL